MIGGVPIGGAPIYVERETIRAPTHEVKRSRSERHRYGDASGEAVIRWVEAKNTYTWKVVVAYRIEDVGSS